MDDQREMSEHHKTVLGEALAILERCGDDAYLDILDDKDLYKAFKDLKELSKPTIDPKLVEYDHMEVTVKKPTDEEILLAKIQAGYNVCLDCIPKGWYDPKTHICSFDACDECGYEQGECDDVCSPPECVHGYDVMPDEWNPELRIKVWTADGEKIMKIDGSDADG
jgi:hypothetical protein